MSTGPSALLVAVGIALMWAGLDLSHRYTGPLAAASAWLSPIGLVAALAGAVSLLVPGFFS